MAPAFLRRNVWLIAAALALGGCASTPKTAQAPPAANAPPAIAAAPIVSCCGPVTPAAEQMTAVLDGMDVQHLWQSHVRVEWRTGEPRGGHGATHCSAFAAAAGERLGIYMLRPPEHGQDFLASAQGRWFGSERGQRDGWKPVSSPHEAQQLANEGNLVVLVYVNPNPHVPGHIAIVRPAVKSEQALEEEGPQTMQAGLHNFASGTAVQSFAHHTGAWPTQVRMFAHATKFEAETTAAQQN